MRWARIKATAVHDPDGGVRLAINVIEDITELKRSEEAQRFLAEASRRFSGSSLDYERTLAAVPELAIPALADRCEVQLVEDELGPEALEVVKTGAAWLEPSRIIVPMTAGRVIGTVTLEVDGREFDTQDVLVAEDFGLRAGAAVENARLYRAASRIARTLQTSLLPPGLPDVPGAQLAAAFHPAGQGLEVGGDFYDVFSTGEGQWYLVIGDVSGKGAEAAAVTALARFTLRTAAARRRSPASILRWVDEAMVDQDAAARALLHDRLRARRPDAFAGAPDGRLRRAPAAGPAARRRHGRGGGRARDAARARQGRGAARPLDRPAPGRHARALHRRVDRGAGAAVDVGLPRSSRRRCGARRSTGRWGSSRASWPARSASAPVRATISRCSRSSSPASPPIVRIARRLAVVVVVGPVLAVRFPTCRCGVPSAGVSSTSGGCSSGYPISDSEVSIPGSYPYRGCRKPAAAPRLGTPRRRDPLMQFSFQFPPADDAPAQARAALEVFDQILSPEVLEDLQLVVSELVTNSVKFGPKRPITLALSVGSRASCRAR